MKDLEILRHPTNSDALCLFSPMESEPEQGEAPIIRFAGSTISEDRYGSVIVPSGGDLRSYLANPVFMWAHDYSIPTIGKSLETSPSDRLISFRVQFAVEEFDFARTVYKLYRGGYMRGVSIGMIPREWESYEAKTIPSQYAENRRYTKWELLELSAAPIPANREALKMALDRHVIAENEVRLGLERLILRDVPTIIGDGAAMPTEPLDSIAAAAEVALGAIAAEEDAAILASVEPVEGVEPIDEPIDALADVRLEHVERVCAEIRAGAVLNKANVERLEAIKALVDEVLASAKKSGPIEEEPEAARAVEPEPVAEEVTAEEVAAIVRELRSWFNFGEGDSTKNADPDESASDARSGSTPDYVAMILGRA